MLTLLLPLLVTAQSLPDHGQAPNIVVIAERTERALAECLARKCGTREDAIASIRHAQTQFAQGTYLAARGTLLRSLRRNGRATEQEPRALSALWFALARVTLHSGDMQEYRRATLRSGSILARSASVTLNERVWGDIQIGDVLAGWGDFTGATRRYASIGAQARERGDIAMAEMMDLRAQYIRASGSGNPAIARRVFARAATDATLTPKARTVAISFAAKFDEYVGRPVSTLLDDLPVQPADAPPLLLWMAADRFTGQSRDVARAMAMGDMTLFNMLQPGSADVLGYRWADIGFWITPNGRVADAEVLRGPDNQAWAKEALRVIGSRRYAPFEAANESRGRYQIERVTLTFGHQTPSGSLIRRRGGMPVLRYEELKVESAEAAS